MKEIFKYENVYQDIVHDIEKGILHDGDKLPSIRVLSMLSLNKRVVILLLKKKFIYLMS